MWSPAGRHSDLDLSEQSFDLFSLRLTVSLQILHFKDLRVWVYCTEKTKTTETALCHQCQGELRLQAVDSNPSFTTSSLCDLQQVS